MVLIHRANYIDPFKQLTECKTKDDESSSEDDESEYDEVSEDDESEYDEVSNSQSEYDKASLRRHAREDDRKLKCRRKYYKKNKEHISRLRKSSFLMCPCGSYILSCRKAQHQNTMKHKLFCFKNPNVEIPTTATHFVEI
tara:strand:+ start:1266 stop:1685 length:420 start_codon:yes stop_codon:yes gene_type:complete